MTTEILCTLGPSSMNERVIKRLEELDVSLLRINLSHTQVSDVAETIRYIQKYSSIPICLDTEGAQIRTGDSLQAPIVLAEHSFVKVCRDYIIGNASQFNLYPRDIVDQIKVPIHIDVNISDVMKRVTQTYLYLLEKNINNIINGEINTINQDHSIASYTRKRLPSDNLIDWNLSTIEIYNFIRALSRPYPGAFTFINKTKLIIWQAKLVENSTEFIGIPGCLVKITPGEGVIVNTGDGYIMVNEVQYKNKEPQCASLILNSLNICIG